MLLFKVFAKNPDIPEQRQEMKDDSVFWSLLFLALGFGSGLGNVVQVSKLYTEKVGCVREGFLDGFLAQFGQVLALVFYYRELSLVR